MEGAREAAEAEAKRDAEAAERARAWAEAEAKETAEISRIAAEAGEKGQDRAFFYTCCKSL